jgi:hypothetical protein
MGLGSAATLVSLRKVLNGFETFSQQYRALMEQASDVHIRQKSVQVQDIGGALVVKAVESAVVAGGESEKVAVGKEVEITLADVELINQRRRKLIQTFEQSMNRRFERWTELYNASSATNDLTGKAAIKVELDLIAGEMCRDYGRVVGYLKAIGKDVEDYYDHVGYICKEMVIVSPVPQSHPVAGKPPENPITEKRQETTSFTRRVVIPAAIASTPGVGLGIAALAGKDTPAMEKIFEIASKTATPLGLAGIIFIAGFFILRTLVKRNAIPALTQSFSPGTVNLIIWLVFVLAVLTLVLAFIGYIYKPNAGTDYTGRVTDSRTNRSIAGALVSIEEDQGVPQTQYTDDQGIFSVKLHNPQTIRIRVESADYEVFMRRGQPSRTGVEDIALVPRAAAPAPSPSPSLGLTFSGNPTIEEVRSTIESAKHVSVQYEGRNCKSKLSRVIVKLNGAQLDGGNVKEILENARTRAGVQYFVKTIKEGDSYAIVCQ